MTQQINLYQSIFKKQTEPMMAHQVLITASIFIALLACLSLYRHWSISLLETELLQNQQQLVSLENKLTPLKQAQASIKKSARVQNQLEERQSKVNTKQQLLKVMSQRSFGNTEGFTEQLTGLAQQRIEGLWLTSLAIRAGGIFMDMQGNSLRPELLPQYIQQLSNEDVFKGTEFESLVMERHESKTGWITFNLKSQNKVNNSGK